MYTTIKNLTDQLNGFTQEVEQVVAEIIEKGYSKNQAIEIVRIGVEDIKVEVMHQSNHLKESQNELLNDIISILQGEIN
ncbi:hypothetical protein [Clostridium manihotivorum]|uniref:Uncharacterized protein n=1 Tax=Clostridium manihotivorum TaxID=2320868 RepID=A0A410DMN9_9CLOT|nr:hypothetical protein [Clostridium manihotivorum]QAA30326.1 hypothetical protein C1I91_00745 [Clostridium manihotivorum]